MEEDEKTIVENTKPASKLTLNAETLSNEINWFARVVNKRLKEYFPKEEIKIEPKEPQKWINKIFNGKSEKESSEAKKQVKLQENDNLTAIDLSENHSVYGEFVNYYQLSKEERFLLILTIIPHIQPHLLDVFFALNKSLGRGFTEFGGIKGARHSGFLPTVETFLFLLAGNNLDSRFRLYQLFESDHIFSAHDIISIDYVHEQEGFISSPILISDEYLEYFTTGNIKKPQFSTAFPAKQLLTKMEWQDLILDDYTANQLDEIRIWLEHGQTLLTEWEMDKKLKPGYKALFYGEPGTGKTLSAALLGKLHNREVYRVDLSMVVSKYIGETEKNLEKVFKKGENKNWILFFDECEALFSKRIQGSDSNSKYANQEIAYLLQRLEDYPSLVILATNLRSNMDEAFTRRLQSVIHFQKPQPKERYRLWMNAFSKVSTLPSEEAMQKIAHQYEISGGSIINVVQYASLKALNNNSKSISIEDITEGINKELRKEGKTI